MTPNPEAAPIAGASSSGGSQSSPDPLPTGDQNEFAFLLMEQTLKRQAEMCALYKLSYEQQRNPSMSTKLDSYMRLTLNDLDLLRYVWEQTKRLPKFRYDTINFFCRPCNTDIKRREIRLEIRTHLMPVSDVTNLYAVAEFGGPTARAAQSLGQIVDNMVKEFALNPKKSSASLFGGSLQLDKVRAISLKPYWDMRGFHTSYERPIRFWLDHECKWRVIKVTFYVPSETVTDTEVGSVSVNLDCLNDKVTSVERLAVKRGSEDTGGGCEVTLRVHRPLLDQSMRYFEEQLLIIT